MAEVAPELSVPTGVKKLKRFAQLKRMLDQAKRETKTVQGEHDKLEFEIVNEWLDTQTRTYSDNEATFSITKRAWPSVKDLVELLKWMQEQELVKGLQWSDDGRVTCTFEVAMSEDKDGNVKPTLVNGALKVDVYQAPLMAHVNELRNNGYPDPPGLKVADRYHILVRQKS